MFNFRKRSFCRGRTGLLICLLFSIATLSWPQQATAQANLPPALASFAFANPFEPASTEVPDPNPAAQNEATPQKRPRLDVTFKSVPRDILGDQKYIWLFPVELARGRHWIPTATIVGLTAGLVVADRYDTPYFYHTTRFNRFTESFNKSSTEAMMAVPPLSLLVFGLVTHDNYAEQTAILSGEAYYR